MNTKQDIEAILPLSPLQGGILFQTLYAPGTGVYFEQFVCRLGGAVDLRAFGATWQTLVDRHPILRTAFVTKGRKEPVQVVFRRLPLTVRELDWSDQPPDEQASRLAEYLAHDRAAGFTFNRPPLMRVTLIRLAQSSWQFIWSHHHILLDGWSLTLLMGEFLTIYEALAAGSEPSLAAPQPYGDYLLWLGRQDRSDAERFWREYLAGLTNATPLGIEHQAAGADGGVRQEHYSDSFTRAETVELEAFAREHRLTLSTIFQAAWALLLSCYSGEDDILYGFTLSGRSAPLPGIERMIGLFINSLPVRVRVRASQKLSAWLQELQSESMNLQQYEYSALTDIQRWSSVPRGRRLFESLLVFENYPTLAPPARAESGMHVESVELVESTDFPLTAVVIPGESLRVKISYDANRIRPSSARQVSAHLRGLVMQMAAGADLPLAAFKLPSDSPTTLSEPTPAEPEGTTAQTLGERFAEAAARHPSRIAVSFEGEEWTYERLAAESSRLASGLRSMGVGAETRVGICMERSPQQLLAMLGVIQAGGAYVPLDPAYPDARLAFMVADSACALVLTTADLKARLETLSCALLSVEECAGAEAVPVPAATLPDHAAYVIYTSGSTGRPKGVLVTHRNVLRLFDGCRRHFEFLPDDVWTYFHSFSFDFSVWEIWGALLHGARVVVVPYLLSREPAAFYQLLLDEGVTVLSQTPSAFQQLTAHEQSRGEAADELSLRYVIFGGEALDVASLRPWFARHGADRPQLINMYGITETTVHVTYRRVVPEDLAAGAPSLIGRPLPDLQIHVLDRHGHPVPSGIKGELCVSGAGLARGYLNNPGATAEKFVAHPLAAGAGERLYRSGDLARRLPDGDLEYCGRADQQVKVRGHRIETGEVNAALLRHEAIREALTWAYTDERGETRLAAYAVCRNGRPPGVEELRFFLGQQLPAYMLPEVFIFCDSFPLTINGKLDVDALPDPASAREELEAEYVAPSNPAERQLAEIWQSVLGVPRVGRNDNFFALGGDSIRSINVMSHARDKGIVFSLQQLFEQQTIGRLVEALRDESGAGEAVSAAGAFALVPEADRGRLPADVEDAYPLARLQAGMLFHSDYGDNSGRYHDALSFRLRLDFDEAKFSASLQSMVDDHPALRTSFHFADLQQPLQFVHRAAPAPLTVSDVRELDEEAQALYLADWLRRQVLLSFDWERPALFRFFVHRLRDDVVELSLIFHHAIMDGWSAATFFKELIERYLHLLNPQATPPAPRAARTYREFIELELAALASEEQRGFWRERLEKLPLTKVPRWPQGEPVAQTGDPDGFVQRSLGHALSDKILAFARGAQLPLKSVLLAVHLRVLQMLTGEEEVVTGLVANGRPTSGDSTRVVGLYLNTIPFRLRLPPGSWLALCQAVLNMETEMLPYRRFPLSEISRLNGNSAPFETSFNFVNFHVYDGLKEQPDVRLLGSQSLERVNIPLSVNFSLSVADASLNLGLMYDRAEFPNAQARALADYYEHAFSSLAANPLTPHADADLLGDEERDRLLYGLNDTGRTLRAPLFVHRQVERQAAETPAAVAVVSQRRQWSYAELDRAATRLARLLLSRGLAPETPVALLAERSFEMVCALLAILKAGCAYVPIDTELPVERIAAILKDTNSPLLLAQQALLSSVPQTYTGEVCVFEKLGPELDSFSDDAPVVPLHPSNLAYVLFTSGSTGSPKGVAVTHEALTNHMQWMQEAFPLTPQDVVLQKTAYSFDASVWEFWAPLTTGAKLVMARPGGQQDPAYLVTRIQEEGVTILQLVPSMLEVLLDEPGFARCRTLRRLYVGGEALKTPVSRRCRQLLATPLINLYGPTEATIDTSAALIGEAETGPTANIGEPIFNTRYYVLDRQQRPVPVGVAGELYVGGLGLARGYWGNAALTAERFVPDAFGVRGGERLYRTGDLVRRLPQGGIEYLGRTNRQLKLRGFRIELADIECALMSMPGIRRSAVIAWSPAEQAEARLVAYYQSASGKALAPSEIKQHLLAHLPAYMVPSLFRQVESWPLLSNGKTDLAALPAPEPARESAGRVAREPSNETERALAAIWRRVLRVEQVGVDDNFFDLGGDSILSLQIVAQARGQGLRFTPRELFNNPSIAGLAAVTQGRETAAPEPSFRPGAEVPLTSVQRFFFEQSWPNIHHFNQALLLEIPPPISAARLRQALTDSTRRHDAFHLRFRLEENGWQQFYGDAQASFAFDEVDLRGTPDALDSRAYATACERAQASLDITEGPLMRAVFFRLDETGAARLLLVCHHLIVDGVSWRILLEDLQAHLEENVDAPDVSLPFGAWARRLAALPPAEVRQAEGAFWREQTEAPAASLPQDYLGTRADNTYASASVLRQELTTEETRSLLAGAPQNLRASVAEVLLACLTETITAWAGGAALTISLEGHGRGAFPDDADLSRSIGWFTSLYPLRVESQPDAGLDARLASVKRQARRVPRGGIGYGLLRYPSDERDAPQAFAGRGEPQILLNYLGRFDNSFRQDGPFRLAAEPTGSEADPATPRSHLLEVVALVVNERLVLQWVYSRSLHAPETIDALAGAMLNTLRRHAEAAQAPRPASWIREDFPLARLQDDAELAEVLGDGQSFTDLWPLAPVQEGILFHSLQAGPRGGVYIQQLSAEIRGGCDVALLAQAWQTVLQQYPHLHATFTWAGLRLPLQRIKEPQPVPFTLLDWRASAATEHAQMLRNFLEQDRAAGLDLRQGPLMRFTLIRLADEAWQLIWTHHHILLDGWSMALLLSRVAGTYRALRDGLPPKLPAYPPYARYLAWLQQQDGPQTERFWRDYLSGYDEPRLVALAEESSADGSSHARTEQLELTLTESLSDQLRGFAQRRNLTVNSVIQAAWGFVLARHSHSGEAVYGVTVSGRPATLPGVEEMVGLFINTLPLRVNVARQQPIDAWLANLQAAQTELLNFQHSRLVDIAGWSELPRGKALFDTILVFENYPVEEALRSGPNDFSIENLNTLEQNSYPLALYVTPGRAFKFSCSFQPQRIPHLDPGALLAHLRQVVGNIVARPGGLVSELEMVSATERKRIVEDLNRTAAAYDRELLLPARFTRAAARAPRKLAVVCGPEQMTYGELEEASNRLARYLLEQGVGLESRVAVLLERAPRMLVALLGVLKAGAAYVPLDPSFPRERLGQIVTEADPQLLISSSHLLTLLPETRARRIDLDSEWAEITRRAAMPPQLDANSENLAYLIFTSGSTGRPKGVQIPHGALVNILECFEKRPGLSAEDVFVAVTTVSFDIAALELFLPLLAGATLALASREIASDGVELARLLEASGATSMQATPLTWRMLLAADWKPSSGFGAWCGGEMLPNDLAGSLLERGVKLWNVYGPTETTIWSTTHEVEQVQTAHLIGRPIANTQVYVLDQAGHPLPAGVAGELHIGGDGLTRGYLNLPGLTAEKLIPDVFSRRPGARLYRTGDLARFTPGGEIEYLGRMDLQTKVDGFRIELGDVEASLRALPGVQDAAAAVVRDERNRNRLVGYLIYQTPGPSHSTSQLRGMLLERVPAYMIPSSWVVLDALPLTANNKFDRKALALVTQRGEPESRRAPRTALEEALLEIWREAFQRSDIGVEDNFFDLGGHSLLATQIHVKLIKFFQTELPLRELFRSPDIAHLAEFISSREPVPGRSDKVARAYLKMKRMSQAEREKVLARGAASTEQP